PHARTRSATPARSADARSLPARGPAPRPIPPAAARLARRSRRSATAGCRGSASPGRAAPSDRSPSRALDAGPQPEADPEHVRTDGGAPHEPSEPLECREDHHEVDVITACDAFIDALESEPTLRWIPVDQPGYGRHAQHDADEED